jgi:hypothetical protein
MLCDDCPQCGQSVVAELKREGEEPLLCPVFHREV